MWRRCNALRYVQFLTSLAQWPSAPFLSGSSSETSVVISQKPKLNLNIGNENLVHVGEFVLEW
jgi:hypothetical protein